MQRDSQIILVRALLTPHSSCLDAPPDLNSPGTVGSVTPSFPGTINASPLPLPGILLSYGYLVRPGRVSPSFTRFSRKFLRPALPPPRIAHVLSPGCPYKNVRLMRLCSYPRRKFTRSVQWYSSLSKMTQRFCRCGTVMFRPPDCWLRSACEQNTPSVKLPIQRKTKISQETHPEVRILRVWGVVLQERLVPVRGGPRGYDDHAAALWVKI